MFLVVLGDLSFLFFIIFRLHCKDYSVWTRLPITYKLNQDPFVNQPWNQIEGTFDPDWF